MSFRPDPITSSDIPDASVTRDHDIYGTPAETQSVHTSDQGAPDSDARDIPKAVPSDDTGDALKVAPPSLFQRILGKESSTEQDAEKLQALEELATGSGKGHAPQKPEPQRFVTRHLPALVEECYPTDHPGRGYCLIIENDEFRPDLQLSQRKGSEVDLKVARKTFTDLGFEILVKRNLHYADLLRLLHKVAGMDHSQFDCFALVVLSHGHEGTIYAYDAAFPTQRLWEPFTAEKAPSLIGKPKLIFLQACQGNLMDPGVQVTKHPQSGTTQTDAFASYKVPVHSDFMIAHSTIAGYYSWRNTIQGSWYIQSLASLLLEHCKERDLMTILTMANKRVTMEYESNSSRREFNNKKQTPFIYSTLTHKLYLDSKKQSKAERKIE